MPTYISELSFHGSEFVEIATDAGTDLSGYSVYIYDSSGAISGGPYPLGSLVTTVAGTDVYVVDEASGLPDFSNTDAIALVDGSGNVVQFISSNGNTVTATEGPADGLTSTDVGNQANSSETLQSTDGGTSYFTETSPNPGTVPCYAPGTMIDTPDGPRAVETLRVGDLVLTLDHGPIPIRWVRQGDQPLETVETDAKPVLIAAGALGGKLPARDLIVSPQHRILVGGHRQLQGLFQTEAFAPAKSLTSLRGIRHMKGKAKITWVHFACDRHEVVTANGCLSESLLLGPMVVNGLTASERQAVMDIFGPAPMPDAALNGPPARECLKVGAARQKLANNSEAQEKLVAKEIRKWDADLAMEQYEAELMRQAKAMNQAPMKSVA